MRLEVGIFLRNIEPREVSCERKTKEKGEEKAWRLYGRKHLKLTN